MSRPEGMLLKVQKAFCTCQIFKVLPCSLVSVSVPVGQLLGVKGEFCRYSHYVLLYRSVSVSRPVAQGQGKCFPGFESLKSYLAV